MYLSIVPQTIVGKVGNTVIPNHRQYSDNRSIGYQQKRFDCNRTQTHNYLGDTETLKHLTKLVFFLYVYVKAIIAQKMQKLQTTILNKKEFHLMPDRIPNKHFTTGRVQDDFINLDSLIYLWCHITFFQLHTHIQRKQISTLNQ